MKISKLIKNIGKKTDHIKEHFEKTDKQQIKHTMIYFNRCLEECKNAMERLWTLDFFMKAISNDLQAECISEILYQDTVRDYAMGLFPNVYYDQNGERKNKIYIGQKKISLKEHNVIVIPWNRDRLPYSIIRIYKNKFQYYPTNHFVIYYKDIDLCYVTGGNHSISVGIVHGSVEEEINSSVYDISDMFEHVYTDGRFWYDIHSKNQLCECLDFRIGILFEIAKIKYKLEHDLEL